MNIDILAMADDLATIGQTTAPKRLMTEAKSTLDDAGKMALLKDYKEQNHGMLPYEFDSIHKYYKFIPSRITSRYKMSEIKDFLEDVVPKDRLEIDRINELLIKNQSMMTEAKESQVNPQLNGEVIRSFGKYTLERVTSRGNKRLVASDGTLTSWIMVYDDGKWSADGWIPKTMEAWLNKQSDLVAVQDGKNKS